MKTKFGGRSGAACVAAGQNQRSRQTNHVKLILANHVKLILVNRLKAMCFLVQSKTGVRQRSPPANRGSPLFV
jgi:hypothetical protein